MLGGAAWADWLTGTLTGTVCPGGTQPGGGTKASFGSTGRDGAAVGAGLGGTLATAGAGVGPEGCGDVVTGG